MSLLFSCQNPDNNNEKDQVEVEKQKTEEKIEVENENFNDFYNHFISDKTFQIERVNFPIEGKYYEEDVARDWTKDNWSYIITNINDIDKNEFNVDIDETETSVSHTISLPNSGFSMSCRFDLINQKWYLTKLTESNF
ncbi:MAG: hypothetical protein PHE33_09425 [Bacteroidales bacterium]|nr:hypothetical protein [Bacteroidales bacterium]